MKWCDQELGDDSQGMVSSVQSLSLVDIEEYNDLYNELKTKYGLEMVKVSDMSINLMEKELSSNRFTIDLARDNRSLKICLRRRGYCNVFTTYMATGTY